MGLSYVKRIIESVNGRIEVASDPDQRRGTSFRVLWPKKLGF
jgi:signal transduction histidine kinase